VITDTYNATTYNCVNFSHDTVKQLREQGYYSATLSGKHYNGTDWEYHAWIGVLVQYDPQTGEEIRPGNTEYEFRYINTEYSNWSAFGEDIYINYNNTWARLI
jgi:hypothetical protein